MLQRHLTRRYSGEIRIEGEDGTIIEAQTLTCCHCSRMWKHQPGSGRTRGFCSLCDGLTCGRRECGSSYHVPFERRLEISESRARLREAVARNSGL